MNQIDIKPEIERLERLCSDAYGLNHDDLRKAIKDLGDSRLKNDFPYLIDAVLTHLLWLKGTTGTPVDEPSPGVYVIAYGSGAVKIGKTKNFKQRLQTLSSSTPHRPSKTYFHPTNAHTDLETLLHRHFKEHRMNGEFFRIDFDVAVAELQRTVLNSACLKGDGA